MFQKALLLAPWIVVLNCVWIGGIVAFHSDIDRDSKERYTIILGSALAGCFGFLTPQKGNEQ